MNKKDYVSFARMIRTQRHKVIVNHPKSNPISEAQLLQIELLIHAMVELFQSDDPKFNAEKFIKACQITE